METVYCAKEDYYVCLKGTHMVLCYYGKCICHVLRTEESIINLATLWDKCDDGKEKRTFEFLKIVLNVTCVKFREW